MRVRGHSASLKLIPFESLGAVSYSIFIWRYFVSYARSSDLLVENHEIFIPHLYLAPPQGGDRVNISRMCLIGYSYSSVTVRSLLPVHERGTAYHLTFEHLHHHSTLLRNTWNPTSFNCLSLACRACDYEYIEYIDYVRRSRSSSCRLLRPIDCQTYITLHYKTRMIGLPCGEETMTIC